MKINDTPYRTIWPSADNTAVEIIDQTKLPHIFETLRMGYIRDTGRVITEMQARACATGLIRNCICSSPASEGSK